MSVVMGSLLALVEGWPLKGSMYFVASVILKLSSPIYESENVPRHPMGQLTLLAVGTWSSIISSAIMALVANLHFTKAIEGALQKRASFSSMSAEEKAEDAARHWKNAIGRLLLVSGVYTPVFVIGLSIVMGVVMSIQNDWTYQ